MIHYSTSMKKTRIFILALIWMIPLVAQTENLDYFIREGLKNSPLLMEVSNNSERNRLDSLLLKATSGFQVGAVGSTLFAPVINGFGYDAVKTDLYNISAQVAVSKELTGNTKRKNQFASLEFQKKHNSVAGKITEQELKKDLTSHYLVAYCYQQALTFQEALLRQLDKEDAVLKALTQAGTYRQTDYLSFQVGRKQQAIQTETIRNQFNASFLDLCWLCGTVDTSVCELEDPQLKANLLPDFTHSIFYHQFELDSLLLENAKKQLDFDYQPKVNLFADAGYLSSLSVAPEKNFGASAGIAVSIPLYDGGQKKLQQSKFLIDERDRSQYAQYAQSQYQQQISNLWRQFRANRTLSISIDEQIDLAKSLLDANHHLLESGDLNMADYLYSIREYLAVKNQALQNTIERYQIINELNYWNRSN
jgi:outer membrane protein TolC